MADEPAPAAVQPEGQGGDGQQGGIADLGLYDLSQVPEHLHEHLAPILKDIEGNATRKLQDGAEARKRLEAYEQFGITEPDQLQEVVGTYLALQDPELRRQWWDAVGEQEGWFEDDGTAETPEEGQLTPERIQQIVQEQIQQAVSPLAQEFAQQRDQQAVSQSLQTIQTKLGALHEQHGDFDDDIICDIAGGPSFQSLPLEEALDKAFERYQQIKGTGEAGLIDSKLGQRGGGLPAGQAISRTEPPKSYEDARKVAMARLEAAG